MKQLTIELDNSEFRVLCGTAHRHVRTPENLARYFIVKSLNLGIVADDLNSPTNASSDGIRQDFPVAAGL